MGKTFDQKKYDNLRESYRSLPETEKKKIFSIVHKAEPEIMKKLQDRAKLGSGGIRISSIAKRDAGIRDIADKYLTAEEGSDILLGFISAFFNASETKYFEKANEIAGIGELIDDSVLQMLPSHFPQGERLASLFSKFYSFLIDWNEEPVVIQRLHKKATSLNELSLAILSLSKYINTAKPFDTKKFHQTLDDAQKMIEDFNSLYQSETRLVAIEHEEWDSHEGLLKAIDNLASAIKNQNVTKDEKLRNFLIDLGNLLDNIIVSHRSSRKQIEIDDLRKKAKDELLAASKEDNPKVINGPDNAQDWLEWASQKAGDGLESLRQELIKSRYLHLADFIEDFDRTWLLAKSDTSQTVTEIDARKRDEVENPDIEESKEKSKDTETKPESETLQKSTKSKTQKLPREETKVKPVEEIVEKVTAEALQPVKDKKSGIVELAKGCMDSRQSKALRKNQSQLVWTLLKDQKWSTAFHLATLFNEETREETKIIPAWIIESLILSKYSSSNQVLITQHLQNVYENFSPSNTFKGNEAEYNRVIRLLLFTATTQPSLILPTTFASTILETLRFGECPGLYEITNAICNFSKQGISLASDIFNESVTMLRWENDLKSLQSRSKEWFERAAQKTFIFGLADLVWQHWLKPNQLINTLINAITRNDTNNIEKIREYAHKLDLDNEIDKTAKATLGSKIHIEARSKQKLIRAGLEALELVNEWIGLLDAKPSNLKGYLKESIHDLRKAFEDHFETAENELNVMIAEGSDLKMSIAAELALTNLQETHSMIDSRIREWKKELNPDLFLHRDLLFMTNLHLTPQWEIYSTEPLDDKEKISLICMSLLQPDNDHYASVKAHSQFGDHLSVARLLELMQIDGVEQRDYDKLYEACEKSIVEWRERITNELVDTSDKLNYAINRGIIRDIEYRKLINELEEIEQRLAKNDEASTLFFVEINNIQRIKSSIAESSAISRDDVYARMRNMKISSKDEKRISLLIDDDDVYLANDYLDRLQRKEKLPELVLPEKIHSFLKFYYPKASESGNGVLVSLISYLKGNTASVQEIISNVETQKNFAGLELSSISPQMAKKYADVLKTWFQIKKRGSIEHFQEIRTILEGLGFNVYKNPFDKDGRKTWITVEAESIITRPISAYGSAVKGQYRILCVFDYTSEKDLLAAFEREAGEKGQLVFYFNMLNIEYRMKLSQLCKHNRKTLIVIDDALIIYLAQIGEDKIKALLDCSLPFSYVMPYSTTASLIPPEVFYGRIKEIERLESNGNNSSCILYGGRQIGKTVLLKHVQRNFSDPTKKRYAKYIDLKYQGIGTARPIDDLWQLLATNLCDEKFDIFQNDIPSQVSYEWFKQQISDWLDTKLDRRILLLLDEADSFLDGDGKREHPEPFFLCSQLKGLMEETSQRFKVVLAGLHNVQRSNRVSNNPLAHYGQTICIGPLLNNGEAREALNLIVEPLACLGIFFENEDLPRRILAQTNYYPNLIQIYCQNLIDHVNEKRKLNSNFDIPPYFVSSSDIKDIYDRKELKDELREKFSLTLELDRRFWLIAHIMALYDEEKEDGFKVKWIREYATDFWEQGFTEGFGTATARQMADDEFQLLLDEMVGLGILRTADENTDCYKLRSRNIVALLGSKNQLESAVMASGTWEAPYKYDAETFRSQIDEEDKSIRSPLTAIQEGMIRKDENGVFVIVGSEASGLPYVPKSLAHIFGSHNIEIIDDAEDYKSLSQKLTVKKKKLIQGKNIYIVSANIAWNINWVKSVRGRIKEINLADSTIGVVFIADPTRLYSVISEWSKLIEIGATLLYLHPWREPALRQWLTDSPIGKQPAEVRNEMSKLTGNWQFLLQELLKYANGRKIDKKSIKEFEASFFMNRDKVKELLSVFGVSSIENKSVFKILAEYDDEMTAKDIIYWSEGAFREEDILEIEKILFWASKLDLLTVYKGYRLDGVVAKIIKFSTTN